MLRRKKWGLEVFYDSPKRCTFFFEALATMWLFLRQRAHHDTFRADNELAAIN